MNEQQPIVKEAPQDIDACLTILGFDSVPQAAKQLAATTLEQSYQLMYANRRLRPIEGPDGIIERTIGQFANGEWQPTFQDTLRGATVESELAEFGTELQKYQNSGDLYDAVQALLELCDIQFQEEVIRQRIATLTNLPPAAQHENLKQIEFALQLFALATQQIILPQLAAAQLQTAPIGSSSTSDCPNRQTGPD